MVRFTHSFARAAHGPWLRYNHYPQHMFETSAAVFARQAGAELRGQNYGGSSEPGDRYDTRTKYEKGKHARVSDSELRDFAQAAYQQPAKLRGYSLVPALSTKETSVYVDPKTKQAIVASRGTASSSDWKSDVAIAGGFLGETARYKRSEREMRNAISNLSGYNVSVTGHSLGASIAKEFASNHPAYRTVGFNTGYSVYDAAASLPGLKRKRHQDGANYSEYLNNADLVSYGSFSSKRSDNRYRYSNGRYALGAHKARPTSWRDV